MDTTFVKNAIDAFKSFVAACGNDVAANDENEYVVFSGQIAADARGNVKTYALVNDNESASEPKKVLVAQAPLRAILDRGADFAKAMVDLYETRKKEKESEAEKEAKAEQERAEVANGEIDSKISDLESQISNLKLQKKPVRRLVKKLSFETATMHDDNAL